MKKTRRRFLLRYHRVFNLEQCELPQMVLDKLPKIETHDHDPIEAAAHIIVGMPNPPEIQYAGSKAFLRSDRSSHHVASACALHQRRGLRGTAVARDRPAAGPGRGGGVPR